MLPNNLRSNPSEVQSFPPFSATPASLLLHHLRHFRRQHPFPSRTDLPQFTPEQFATRAIAWDTYLDAQADQRREETIQAIDADTSWQTLAGLEEIQ